MNRRSTDRNDRATHLELEEMVEMLARMQPEPIRQSAVLDAYLWATVAAAAAAVVVALAKLYA